jgi:hypothetical protein
MEHFGLHSLHDHSISSLDLPVRQWVRHRWWLMLDTKIRATSDELCSFELCTIIYQDSSGHVESVYYALQELNHCLLGYMAWLPSIWWTCQLRQISIRTLLVPSTGAHNVNSLDCKGPGDINRPKRIDMLHCLLLKELTVFTPFYDFHRIIL